MKKKPHESVSKVFARICFFHPFKANTAASLNCAFFYLILAHCADPENFSYVKKGINIICTLKMYISRSISRKKVVGSIFKYIL